MRFTRKADIFGRRSETFLSMGTSGQTVAGQRLKVSPRKKKEEKSARPAEGPAIKPSRGERKTEEVGED